MNLRLSAAVLAGFFVGCDASPTTNNAPSGGATPATAGSGKLQTVEGGGVVLQAPSDWRTLPGVEGSIALASPFDFKAETAGIAISISIQPVPAPATPTGIAASLLEIDHLGGEIESETAVTVAEHAGTKVVRTMTSRKDATSTDVMVTRMIHVYVALDTTVLVVQAHGTDAEVKQLTPQVDAIIESIRLM